MYSYSSSSFTNVTISGNSSAAGGGIYFLRNSILELVNCILWNDLPQEIYFHEDSEPNMITISYTDIETGQAGIVVNNNGTVNWLEGNLSENPLFANPDIGDFQLTENSPCIDTGDPTSQYDPDGTRADMGALYFQHENSSEDTEIPFTDLRLSNFPNPFNPSTTISFELDPEFIENTELSIYNLKGQKVKTISNDQITQSLNHQIIWNGTDQSNNPVSSGIYYYKLNIPGSPVRKMVLLK